MKINEGLTAKLQPSNRLVMKHPNQQNREITKEVCYIAITNGFESLEDFYKNCNIPYIKNEIDTTMYELYKISIKGEPIKFWDLPKSKIYRKAVYIARLQNLAINEFYAAYGFNYKRPVEVADETVRLLVNRNIEDGRVVFKGEQGRKDYYSLEAIAKYRSKQIEELSDLEMVVPEEWKLEETTLRNKVKEGLAAEEHKKLLELVKLKKTTLKSLYHEWGFDYVDEQTIKNYQELQSLLIAQYPTKIIPSLSHLSAEAKTKIRSLRRIGGRSNESVLEELGYTLLTQAEYNVLMESQKGTIVDSDSTELTEEEQLLAKKSGLVVKSFKEEYLITLGFNRKEAHEIMRSRYGNNSNKL